jgi:hypothetical protein
VNLRFIRAGAAGHTVSAWGKSIVCVVTHPPAAIKERPPSRPSITCNSPGTNVPAAGPRQPQMKGGYASVMKYAYALPRKFHRRPGTISSNIPRGICFVNSTVKKATNVRMPVSQ